MKRIINAFLSVLAVVLAGLFAHTVTTELISLDPTGVFSFLTIDADGLSLAASLMALKSGDPERWRRWTEKVFKLGEEKTEFNESEIGVTYADDGPKPSQRVKAAPILYEQKLMKGGRYMSIKTRKPLFTDPETTLKKGRYEGQDRIGAEQKLSRDSVEVCVDEFHIGLKEEDIQIGSQSTANMKPSQLIDIFTDAITDNNYSRKDWGMFWALFAGSDMHHYINAGLRKSQSNGAIPTSDDKNGLRFPMMEHPNTYVWHNGKLNKIAYNATMATYSAAFTTELDKVTDSFKPTLGMLKRINRIAVTSNMIPCQFRNKDGRLHSYYLLYVPGKIRDLLEEDTDFKDVMTSAYEGMVKNNPMLNDDDVPYKNLIIRTSTKLDHEYFSLKNSFNAEGDGASVGDCSFNKTTVGSIEWADIDLGERQFTSTTPAHTAYGATGTNNLGRMLLLGANAGIRASGKEFEIDPMEITNYGKDDGVGLTSIYGQHRNQQFDPDNGNFAQAYNSMQIISHMGAY